MELFTERINARRRARIIQSIAQTTTARLTAGRYTFDFAKYFDTDHTPVKSRIFWMVSWTVGKRKTKQNITREGRADDVAHAIEAAQRAIDAWEGEQRDE